MININEVIKVLPTYSKDVFVDDVEVSVNTRNDKSGVLRVYMYNGKEITEDNNTVLCGTCNLVSQRGKDALRYAIPLNLILPKGFRLIITLTGDAEYVKNSANVLVGHVL